MGEKKPPRSSSNDSFINFTFHFVVNLSQRNYFHLLELLFSPRNFPLQSLIQRHWVGVRFGMIPLANIFFFCRWPFFLQIEQKLSVLCLLRGEGNELTSESSISIWIAFLYCPRSLALEQEKLDFKAILFRKQSTV